MKIEQTTLSQVVLTDMLKGTVTLYQHENPDIENTVTVELELLFNINDELTLEQMEKLSFNVDAIGSRASKLLDELDLRRWR